MRLSYRIQSFIDRVPLTTILILAVILALMPFVPEPHLWEKFKMLQAGTLTKPLDIFDVFWHSWPLALLAYKLVRISKVGGKTW